MSMRYLHINKNKVNMQVLLQKYFYFLGEMMNINEVKLALNDRIIAKVAEGTGLNPHTIYRIKKGKTKPNKSTLKLLCNYLVNGVKDAN